MTVSGPTSCGKTYFLKQLLQNLDTVSPKPQRIIWLYRRWQPLYEEIKNTVLPRVQFIQGIPLDLENDSFLDPTERNLIILDDLMSTAAKDPRITDLFTEGSHHRNLSVVVLNQNLYYYSKDPTQRRNCHYLVMFNSPIDKQQVMTLAKQMYPGKVSYFLNKFQEAIKQPFGYLLVDLKPTTLETLRLRANILEENVRHVTQTQIITNTAVREDLQHYTEKIRTKRARPDNQSDNEYVLNDNKHENKAFLKIGKLSRDYNEEARESKITKYLKRGLSKTEAKQRANDKLKNEDWIIFMYRYLQMAIKKYRHQLENFIKDSQNSGKDDDTESEDNESDNGNDSQSGSEDESNTDDETDNENDADMQPAEVTNSNEEIARLSTYFSSHSSTKPVKRLQFRYKKGDKVRITHLRNVFSREYDQKWTGEIFTVFRRYWRAQTQIYQIKDYYNEEITGSFYQSELQKVDLGDNEQWKIEKIIKGKGTGRNKQYFVKWLNWPVKFNSWVKASDVKDL
ncbi:unnamed protein product [Mytilus coruscus]|uniref:Chromo domain-containing protein n=1 Tax=Mytilus coruscus TaxID=42192 RepID=A0A6J8BKC5_MYTCO|nr:unnamed protein product [Mytilus coruscus]